MFSGKSEELVRRVTRAQIAGKKTVAFKPKVDHRYGVGIKSHSGSWIDAGVLYDEEIDVLGDFSLPYDVIAIDEIQFFPEKIIEQILKIVNYGKLVIVSGLDQTYRQEPFGILPVLLSLAERVDKLNAVCHKCGEDAYFTQRLVDGEPAPFDGPTVEVGGLESYEARCRNCFQRA